MAIAYSGGGSERFASDLIKLSTKIKPLNDWNMVYVSMKEDDPRGVNFYLGQDKLPTFISFDEAKLDPNSSNILIMPLNIYKNNFEKEVSLAKDKYQLIYSKPVLYKQHKKIKEKDMIIAIIPTNPKLIFQKCAQ